MKTVTQRLAEAISAAYAADDAYEAAVHAAGFKSRWDCPSHIKTENAALQSAYQAKVTADVAVSRAFEASRSKALS